MFCLANFIPLYETCHATNAPPNWTPGLSTSVAVIIDGPPKPNMAVMSRSCKMACSHHARTAVYDLMLDPRYELYKSLQ